MRTPKCPKCEFAYVNVTYHHAIGALRHVPDREASRRAPPLRLRTMRLRLVKPDSRQPIRRPTRMRTSDPIDAGAPALLHAAPYALAITKAAQRGGFVVP